MESDNQHLGPEELQEMLSRAERNLSDLEKGMERDLRSTSHPNLHTAIRRSYGPKLSKAREEISKYREAIGYDSEHEGNGI